ncbi:MAG: ABC transporter ATP-binding protein [Spirochaetia bacterium]|nr:ABC transporter ATP-binding protein [Spirochaetia bacterium]MCF7946729.1 ABC transporter ATP-binding protein [Spirochaetia bacterium]MCF7952905.1 ABC transporter ATP-binding protein [Spirochaetales bacterium]
MNDLLLDVKNLSTSFFTHQGEVQAVRNVSFKLEKGEILGVVGESGCGKSVTMLSVMKLLQFPGDIINGTINFKGKDLVSQSDYNMRSIRGNDISMIFQDPLTSLNPVYTVGNQLIESIRNHRRISRKEAKKRAIEALRLVDIPSAEERIQQYPYEMSGGMRQRVMIAMALSCEPDLLIADEPTTALDVTIQAQILSLMEDLIKRINTAIVLITHDLGVVADFCQRVMIMYGGIIVEEGPIREIFYHPMHPYTQGLLGAVPSLEMDKGNSRLTTIPGTPPDLISPPAGCPFFFRCPNALEICNRMQPEFTAADDTHAVRCWLYDHRNPNFRKTMGESI